MYYSILCCRRNCRYTRCFQLLTFAEVAFFAIDSHFVRRVGALVAFTRLYNQIEILSLDVRNGVTRSVENLAYILYPRLETRIEEGRAGGSSNAESTGTDHSFV